MKRSEMVYKIARIIYDNSMKTTVMESLPVAEKILSEIEQTMKPPFKEKCPVLFTDKFVWEKE